MKKSYLTWIFFVVLTCFGKPVLAQDTYQNPILAGFYPDPSICRVGDNYYLVNSTFTFYPGIPVFKSSDLVHWQQLGHVLDRPAQLDLDGLAVSMGIFAPGIRYHEGTFYVTCTVVGHGGNFVVTATNPAGPWSEPHWLPEVKGIDPTMFFDKNGKAYIVYNSSPPNGKALYQGHRALRMYEMDLKTLKVTGENKILVNGGTDLSKKPTWIEGPRLFQQRGYYYLMAAQGGTEFNHSEVIFRSKHVDGPYVPYDQNPILTQRNQDPSRPDPVTSTGHADLVQTPSGEWYGVFLGCRPYEGDFYNTGRETFLAPVKWVDDWPVFDLGDDGNVKYNYPVPKGPLSVGTTFPYSGNFTFTENFDTPTLAPHWSFLRTVKEKWYNFHEKPGYLAMRLRPETCSGKGNPSFIGHRQQHLNSTATIKMSFGATTENEKAGLVIFQNGPRYYYLCKSVKNKTPVIELYQVAAGERTLLKSATLQTENDLLLKISSHGDTYSFAYAPDPTHWQILADQVDAKFLSKLNAGGFVGAYYAMYATSMDNASDNKAYFDWFTYQGNDKVFEK